MFNENFDIDGILDVLTENYGFSLEEADELIDQIYEDDLEELAEAVVVLMEDYGYDEDEAFDILLDEGFVRRVMAGTRIPTGVSLAKAAHYEKKAEKLRRKADKYDEKYDNEREIAKGHAEVFNAIEDEKTKRRPYRDRRQIYVNTSKKRSK